MSDSSDLEKAFNICLQMDLLIDTCKEYSGNLDMWEIHWDSFWELSNDFPFSVEWCDMDTSYEDDILARYLAIQYFMEEFKTDLRMKHNLEVWARLEE